MSVKQAPGWWPNLLTFECERCGFVGPVRDFYKFGAKALLTSDELEHRRDCLDDGDRYAASGDDWLAPPGD